MNAVKARQRLACSGKVANIVNSGNRYFQLSAAILDCLAKYLMQEEAQTSMLRFSMHSMLQVPPVDPAQFVRLRLPEKLVALALSPPGSPRTPREGLIETNMERLVATLPMNDRPSTLRLSGLDVDALIVAAVRTCAALASEVYESSHRQADRVRYGLVPALRQLGLWELKRLVEDAALKAETPERFEKIATDFAAFLAASEPFIAGTCELVRDELVRAGNIAAAVAPDPCHVDGVSRRLNRLELQDALEGAGVTEFYDMIVVVPTEIDCYRALASVHRCGTPVPRTLEDLIPEPRTNGHSGIVTHVSMAQPRGEGPTLVVQILIQTPLMRDVTRYGIAYARRYAPVVREGSNVAVPRFVAALLATVEQRLDAVAHAAPRLIRVLAEGGRERRPKTFDIPEGATVLDLAYHIHRALGNEAIAAKVNRRRVKLGHVLEPNARVEVIRGTEGVAVRTEADLELVTTQRARRYLRQQLNRDTLTRGRRLLRQYIEKHRRVLIEDAAELDRAADAVAQRYKSRLEEVTADGIYRLLGSERDPSLTVGGVGSEIVHVLGEQRADTSQRAHAPSAEWMPTFLAPTDARGKRLRICGRCHPTQAHEIVGLDRPRHVTVHKRACPSVRDRPTVALQWKRVDRTVLGVIALFCEDRGQLVNDVYHRIYRRGSGLAEIHATTDDFARARITVHVYSTSALALGDLLEDLRGVPSVRSVKLVHTSLPDDETERLVTGDWQQRRRDLERVAGPDAPVVVVERALSNVPRRGKIVLPYNEQKPTYWSEHFFGRTKEIEKLVEYTNAALPSYVFLYGPRISGKTSLAMQFPESLPALDAPYVFRLDLRTDREASSRDILWKIATKLRHRLGGPGAHERADPVKAINALIAGSDRRVLLILDEFAAVLESFRDGKLGTELFDWIRTTMDADYRASETSAADSGALVGQRLRLVCVSPPEGRELLQLPSVLPYLQRLKPLSLWTLDPDAATEMIMAPFAGTGVQFQRDAVTQVVQLTGGHPYYVIIFLNEIGEMLNGQQRKTIVTPKDVTRCANAVLNHESCWSGAVQEPGGDPAHHAILRAVAQLQETRRTYVDRSEILQKAKLAGAEADDALDRLVTFHLLDRRVPAGREVNYGFTIPLVRSWVRRHSSATMARKPLIGLPAPP